MLRHGRRVDAELLGRIRRLTRCEVLVEVAGRPVESTLVSSDFRHLETQAALTSALDTPVILRLFRSTEPEERFLASLRGHLLLIGLGVLGASLLFARTVTLSLTGPVNALVRAAIRLERGEADVPLEIRTGDELEYLGRRFGEMRTALHSQIRSLRELDRMKSTFLAIASHELRTPATIIQGNVELLGDLAPSGDEQYPEVVEGLQRGVSRLQAVLERIGDLALLDSERMRLSMRPLEAHDLLPELTLYWRQIARDRGVEFRTSADSESAPLLADPVRLRQALQNLLHNALRFTPDGGQVHLHLAVDDTRATFAVEDSGIGVPPEHRERIFEAFYEARDVLNHRSGDNEFGSAGLGLGLALARSIAEAHRGRIAYSPLAEGSRFVLEVPLERTEAMAREAA